MRLPAWILLLLPLLAPPAARADTGGLGPDDFAYGVGMGAPGTYATWGADIPPEVYRAVVWPDLRDVAVFNAVGELLPFRLEHKPWADVTTDVTVAFRQYPILGGSASGDSALVELRAAGGAVSFRYIGAEPPGGSPGQEPVSQGQSLLVDLGETHAPVSEIRLDWTAPASATSAAEALLRVAVESSPDLQSWRTVHPVWNLARLSFQGEALIRDSVPLHGLGVRYLRLRVLDPGSPRITVREVIGRSHARSRAEPRWLTAPARAGEAERSFEFAFDGSYPIDRVRVALEENMLLRLVVESRADPETSWQARARGTVYRARFAPGGLEEDTVTFPAVPHRHWRIRIESGGAALPPVAFGWVPHRMIFLPRGTGPFTLAYGRADIDRRPGGLEHFERMLRERGIERAPAPGRAELKSAMVLGGEDLLRPRPAVPLWKQAALWSLLILIVLAVAWMAWRLYGELQESEKAS